MIEANALPLSQTANRQWKVDTNPRQFAYLIGIEHQFLERVGISDDVIGNREEVAVSFVDVVDLLVAGLE